MYIIDPITRRRPPGPPPAFRGPTHLRDILARRLRPSRADFYDTQRLGPMMTRPVAGPGFSHLPPGGPPPLMPEEGIVGPGAAGWFGPGGEVVSPIVDRMNPAGVPGLTPPPPSTFPQAPPGAVGTSVITADSWPGRQDFTSALVALLNALAGAQGSFVDRGPRRDILLD